MSNAVEPTDLPLARAAVARGWLTEPALAAALAAWGREAAAGRPAALLGALLVERGDLSPAQLATLRAGSAPDTLPAQDATVIRPSLPPQAAQDGWAAAGGDAPRPSDAATLHAADRPASAARPVPVPAALAGRYEVVALLGRGGMGVVYRARDLRLDREVALKLLLLGANAQREDVERFHREAHAAAALQHPGIVQVLDVGEADGRPFYTMELVAGSDVAEAIRARTLSPRDAVEVVRQVAEALAVAHARGVLHRDIKPRNMILECGRDQPPAAPPAGRGCAPVTVKLLDFGLAKFAEREVQMTQPATGAPSLRTLTRTGQLLGTPSYMSPEQLEGAAAVDTRSDLYSLGASLYEMFTGRPPFDDAATLADLMRRIAGTEPLPPRRLVPDLDRDFETICLKCLQKEPKDRYASASELAADCRRALAGEPIAARPVGPLARLWKRARRNPAVALPVAALVLVLVGLGAAMAGHEVWRRVQVARAVAGARSALARRGAALAEGEKLAGRALELAPGDREALNLAAQLRSAQCLADGDESFARYLEANAQAAKARAAHAAARCRLEQAATLQEKKEMWELAAQAETAGQEREKHFARAVAAFVEAQRAWPAETAAGARLGQLYLDRYFQAEAVRNVADQNAFGALVQQFAPESSVALLRGEKDIRVTFWLPRSWPAGSQPEAYLFRYAPGKSPPVLLPIPCSERTGEAVADPLPGPAEPVPVAALSPSAGLTDALRRAREGTAYPLRRLPENRATFTRGADPGSGRPNLLFSAHLPRGSYLLYFPPAAPDAGASTGRPPGPGIRETRYPFEVVRGSGGREACELLDERDGPPLPPAADPCQAWVYVPAGSYRASGDPLAFQPVPRDEAYVRVPGREDTGGFFIGRFEVTLRMYLAYLNDRRWHAADAAAARAPRRARRPAPEDPAAVADAAGVFRLRSPSMGEDWPLFGISLSDATDYVAWLNRQGDHTQWKIGVPTEDEWELAARGPDGRFHPWGDVFDPGFCYMIQSRTATPHGRTPEPVGSFPLDESPFGVRDLAGGVSEWTSTCADPDSRTFIYKGGNFFAAAHACRGAYRSVTGQEDVSTLMGLRLCARRRQ